VFVGDTIQDVVVFVGFRDTGAPAGIRPEGTGFLIHYDEVNYLVTARHVAKKLGLHPFVIRANRHKGAASLFDADYVKWHYPEDKLIDLAVTPVTLQVEAENGPLYFPQELFLTESKMNELVIGIGDECYTVGLFHFIAGHRRNLPMLYTGNIALLPPSGEKIPVGNEQGETDHVEAYLIESGAINGASGAPVFVRSSRGLKGFFPDTTVMVTDTQFYLFGVFQAAWFLPPDEPLRLGVRAKPTDIVPVGLGVVVPATKLIELLEGDAVKNDRKKRPRASAQPGTGV
jgi:hypothetical protein